MSRDELTDAVLLALRESSGLGVLHSQAMAERLGVSSTDLECLDIIAMRGPITAGELARASGLTTGAITGLVDRLERAGLARREPDAADRRKVLLRVTPAVEKRGAGLAKPMRDAMTELLSNYDDQGARPPARHPQSRQCGGPRRHPDPSRPAGAAASVEIG